MPINLEHVKEVISKSFSSGAYKLLKGREHVAVYIKHLPLKAGTDLRIGYNSYKIENDSILVFIDLIHEANFSHPVIYELHSVDDGQIRTINEEWPIADPEMERNLIPFILPGKEVK